MWVTGLRHLGWLLVGNHANNEYASDEYASNEYASDSPLCMGY